MMDNKEVKQSTPNTKKSHSGGKVLTLHDQSLVAGNRDYVTHNICKRTVFFHSLIKCLCLASEMTENTCICNDIRKNKEFKKYSFLLR